MFLASSSSTSLFCIFCLSDPWSRWEGTGVDEHAINVNDGKVVVRVDPAYFRPAEVEYVFQKICHIFGLQMATFFS